MLRKLFFLLATSLYAATQTFAADHIINSDSCFAHIDSNLYVVAESMPLYNEEVYVGKVSPAGYDVKLYYPEFKPLSKKEIRAIRELQKAGVVQSDAELDSNGVAMLPSPSPVSGLNMQQSMLIDRKEGSLNVRFSPIVRHEGEWKRILSCQIKVSEISNGAGNTPHRVADDANRWAEKSVLAQGKWVKVRVTKEGIYQLTTDDIKKMGFTDLSKVKVYGYGGLLQNEVLRFSAPDESVLSDETPDDLVEVPVMRASGDRILFWAEGTVKYNWNSSSKKYTHTQNHYSTYSYYFVTEDNNPRQEVKLIEDEVNTSRVQTLTHVPYVVVNDNDCYSWYNGGRRMFDSFDFANASSHTYKLDTPGFDSTASGTKSIEINIGASSTISRTQINVKANGQSLGNVEVEAFNSNNESAQSKSSTFSKTDMLYSDEANSFVLTSSSSNKASLDYIRINYQRKLSSTTSGYSFSPQVSDKAVRLEIADANDKIHIWRIGQKGCPTAELKGSLVDGNVYAAYTSTGQRRFVYFNESNTFDTPSVVGEVANQNLHADAGIDYVIIVPANGKLVEQATRIGDLHKQRDGLTYKVLRADQLYNEFSSGTPDANAYRRYLKMLYDRAGDDKEAMPRYCLFMGKSYWDNRFLNEEAKGKNPDDYLLSYESDASSVSIGSVNSFVTDDFFGLLDDGEGANIKTDRLDIAMGRMICANEAEAKLLVDKTERYINNEDAGSWKNTVAMLADDGDRNDHMEGAESVAHIIGEVAPSMDVQKVYWDRYYWTSSATGYTYPQGTARIRQLMTEGALLFNYSGHGSPNMISHYKLLLTSDFAKALSPHMAVWVLASCEIYPFDSEEANLAETSLYVPDGGSVAFMCATRAVYGNYNTVLNKAFCKNVFSRDDDGKFYTLGEALRLAKKQMIEDGKNGDQTINKLKFVCFGDPAMRLGIPTGKVVLDSINGKAVNTFNGLEQLTAGSAVKFAGHVCPGNGNDDEVDTAFDGTVSTTIFDCAETITCKDNQKTTEGNPMVFDERSKSIYKGSAKANAGKFEFTVCIPRDISYTDRPGRISFYAVSNDKQTEYNGVSESFCLNGTSPMEEPDTKGPEVVAYINDIDNPDYTITDENPVLIANISDDYGINNTGISLGHDIELVIDDNASNCINLNSYFTYDFGSYQKGQLVYPMTNMPQGKHSAQLRVWDVNNNLTIADVHFIVRSKTPEVGKDGYVTSTKNPATTDTRFITYFPADTEVKGIVTYEVFDTRGRCVYKQPIAVAEGATNASHTWNLCGNDGAPLPAGLYFYRTVFNSSNGSNATDAQKLIIVR